MQLVRKDAVFRVGFGKQTEVVLVHAYRYVIILMSSSSSGDYCTCRQLRSRQQMSIYSSSFHGVGCRTACTVVSYRYRQGDLGTRRDKIGMQGESIACLL
jgi:hypothetical protein